MVAVADRINVAWKVIGIDGGYGLPGNSLNGFTNAIRCSEQAIATEQAKRFTRSAIRTILARRGDPLVDLVTTNVTLLN
jgi:hypothetical protein